MTFIFDMVFETLQNLDFSVVKCFLFVIKFGFKYFARIVFTCFQVFAPENLAI